MKSNASCLGVQCPIKNQCRRYTHSGSGNVIRCCRNQKMYVQDEEKINRDSLRK